MKRTLTLLCAVILSALSVLATAAAPALSGEFKQFALEKKGTQFFIDAEVESAKYIKDHSLYVYALASHMAHMYKLCSSNECKNDAINLRLAMTGFRNITQQEIPEQWQGGVFKTEDNTNRIYDQEGSGLLARVFINDKHKVIVIAFAGTEFNPVRSGWRTPQTLIASAHAAGLINNGHKFRTIPHSGDASETYVNKGNLTSSYEHYFEPDVPMLNKADEITRDILQLKRFKGYRVKLTGSSLGGAIAQYVALKTGAPATVLNSLALDGNITNYLATYYPDNHPEKLIRHVYLEGEALNDSYGSQTMPNALGILIQGTMPVPGYKVAMPQEVAEKIDGLYLTSPSTARHWTGSILKVFEHYLGLQDLPSLDVKNSYRSSEAEIRDEL